MCEPLRILLIDDSADDRLLTICELRREFADLRVEEITGAKGFAQALEKGAFDLVITDYQLLWSHGLAVLSAVKDAYPDLPVIMFTAAGSEEIAVEAMKGGLDDYVLKSHKHFVRLSGAVRSALERARDRQSLKESEEKYRKLTEIANDAIFLADAETGIILEVNKRAEKMLGMTAAEIVGLHQTEIHPKDEAQRYVELFEDRVKGGRGIVKDLYVCHRDGRKIPVEISVSFIELGGRRICQGIFRDMTEHKLAEEGLKESEERFRSLSENAPDIIYCLGVDGSFTYVNPAWEKLLGHTREEVLGKHFTDFAKSEDAKHYVTTFESIRDRNETLTFVIGTLIHKDGASLLFNLSGAPNFDSKGMVAGIVGVLKDITEHRRLEAQLLRTEKMKAIGTLAGGIAHDFNNLLMGILGNASMMLSDIDSSHPHCEKLRSIERHVESGAGLTRQLLGFARGGKYEVMPTDLNDLIKKTSDMFGRTKKEIRIHRKYQENIKTVEVDQSQIEHVLVNLFVNASQSMPAGGDLYLCTENVFLDDDYVKPFNIHSGNYVKISVADTGVGMDEATLQRIFEPFFTTKEMGRGTGLGLASAYGIIKSHGGIINVSSKPGEGATFNIYLPAVEKRVAEEKKLPEEVLRGRETILLVDDEDMIIDVGAQMLKKLGYEVLVARGGKEAIQIYKKNQHKIDMLILDMIMPDMGGGETYDILKKIDPDVKVLLSSGYSINGRATQILECGCNGFIQKAFTMEELSQKVRAILE